MDKFFGKKNWKIGLVVAVFAILVLPTVVNAAPPEIGDLFTGGWWGDKNYGLLACEGEICDNLCQLLDLLNNLLFFGLTLLLYIIAPVRFIIGGFLIMISQGNSERLSKGISTIKGTAIGVLIALGGFAIVATFLWMIGNNTAESGQARVAWPEIACRAGENPNPPSTDNGTGDGDGTGDGTGDDLVSSHSENIMLLQGVATIWSSGVIRADCGSNPACTSLEGLPYSAIEGLEAIKTGCDRLYGSCNLIVTGGTETAGHKTHGPGRAIVDIEDTKWINTYIGMKIGDGTPTPYTWYTGSDGYKYFYETNWSHWHVCFAEPCYIKDLGD